MNQTLTTTAAAALHVSVGPGVPLDEHADEAPRYRHIGNQRFVPANDPARLEVARWNAYADAWNARTVGTVGEVLQ